ncbi:glycosyltransferase 87 family protein [Lentzea aerocolonigenes]|uniref:glycosyltransferase 87 family protein n=1 Tax=Lentzea aerocolonigenes TaxID=68170 RepID=UPI0006983EBC|nr:glycosyltransferase 87 family protein [Lentzea aerocolonigenes]
MVTKMLPMLVDVWRHRLGQLHCRRIVGVTWVLALIVLPIAWAGDQVADMMVYRNGGLAWLRDLPLYVDFPGGLGGPDLPFTYPPMAALLFTSLTVAPWWLVHACYVMVSFTALSLVCVVIVGRVRPRLMWTVGPIAAIVLLQIEPVRSTFALGQVNLVLMALIVLDCLVVKPKWRGVLIGIAAAVKLTPAIFVLYLLFKRDWRAAMTSGVTFAGLAVAGFLLAPKDSVEFWFRAMLNPGSNQTLWYVYNQSLHGALLRLLPSTWVESLLWVCLSIVVVVLGAIVAQRAQDDIEPMLAIAAVGLLISPISWSHHWVWCVPAILCFAMRATTWLQRSALLGVAAVFFLQPADWLPCGYGEGQACSLLQHAIADAYVWTGIGLLVALAVLRRSPIRTQRPGFAAFANASRT